VRSFFGPISRLLFVPYALADHDGYVRRLIEHFGETRDERIREFHEMNDTLVLGLWEGGLLRVDGSRVTLLGKRAGLFRRGQEAIDLEPGSSLDAFFHESRK
jgi:dipeptidase E